MEDYKINIVSEHLKDRHPYNELPFNERYNPTEVYKINLGISCSI